MNVSILKSSDDVNNKRRKSQVDSMNREMKSIQLNYAQDKLLELNNQKLDKEMNKEYRYSQHTTQGLKQEQEHINKRTPSTETWLRQHQGHYETWKAQEREKLLKRHKSLMKSYRIPNQDSCDRQKEIVRSKTFVARDKNKDNDLFRSRQNVLAKVADRRNSSLLRRHSLAVSEVSSRRSSVNSSVL